MLLVISDWIDRIWTFTLYYALHYVAGCSHVVGYNGQSLYPTFPVGLFVAVTLPWLLFTFDYCRPFIYTVDLLPVVPTIYNLALIAGRPGFYVETCYGYGYLLYVPPTFTPLRRI